MIRFVSEMLGINVPEPFYRGFPDTVRELSADKLLFDQLVHYTITYGFNMFDEAGHSLFESCIDRTAFDEETEMRDFSVISEDEAVMKISEIVGNLLLSSRPLSDEKYAFVLEFLKDYNCDIEACASKNTAIRLLMDSRRLVLTRFITMSDVIKLVDEMNYSIYGNENIKKLNLNNQDRKFITKVINKLFADRKVDIETCCEKKAIWNGLLYHIHYKPSGKLASSFVKCICGKENLSVYSKFEKALAQQDIKKAVTILSDGKSPTTVLRNLSFLISRCSSQEDIDFVIENIDSDNVLVLIQLLMHYSECYPSRENRVFTFTVHNKMKVHYETDEETMRRRSVIPEEAAIQIFFAIDKQLRKVLKGRLGKVYLDPAMKHMALPLQENTSQGGFGVLPKGSRIPIEPRKKVRAFTYWEKVNDIDLSVIGLDDNGNQYEYSWRTMAFNQSDGITYSGDQTSGYYGGSEYFDIDVERFKEKYPQIKYLIFCDNVYSGLYFDKCFCKAGFMLRDALCSGEVYEPKSVQSSFLINCSSTFAYLFGIDLRNSEFVWLNVARGSSEIVAGTTSLDFLKKYFAVTSNINMYTFFEMMATEMVDDPSEAELIVSDNVVGNDENTEVIRSCDFDKVLALMNA